MPVERRQLVGDLPGEGDDVRLWQGKVVETNRATGDDLDVGQRLLDGLAHGPHRPGVKDVLGRRVVDEPLDQLRVVPARVAGADEGEIPRRMYIH